MEDKTTARQSHDARILPPSHRRALSGSSLLSRIPFMRSSADLKPAPEIQQDGGSEAAAADGPAATTTGSTCKQQKTRRRRGSLRKVALLGRGAQRDRRDGSPLTIDTARTATADSADASKSLTGATSAEHDALGLGLSGLSPVRLPRSSHAQDHEQHEAAREQDQLHHQPIPFVMNPSLFDAAAAPEREAERSNSYNSTTDEDDLLPLPAVSLVPRTVLSASSGSESYFVAHDTADGRRSLQQAKSPLSYSGISTSAVSPAGADWDYSETEWWGWVVLGVTWCVFVIGMGSCLGVWSWAWDVGKTPYAPPELEDDPTLPIVGYYPALIIMTGVMAWVWVVVAWVGMKYFRHAKIGGD
ncbi:hypothetical protein CDD81_3742 [Ophiocordyceps australis]|uniref:Uncharacterized protein n=1 Tax=Ophiocordyceps australis TaxID=1399860 RepID=A0A2C5Y5X6_9HYPO|nr:hypothetical protein CDD81_3742 [Ophiocordyceps australis]